MKEIIQQNVRISRRLRSVRVVALVDLVLLVALVYTAITGKKEIVRILGPLHGINFLLLLVIVGLGALDGVWTWWFPVAVLLTAGPPGAFLGEWLIHRRIKAQNTSIRDIASFGIEVLTIEKETDISNSPLASTKEHLLKERKEQA